MTNSLKLKSAIALSVFASMQLGCSVAQPVTVVGGNPLPLMNMGDRGASISLSLHNAPDAGFATKAYAQALAANVTWYEIELVRNQNAAAATGADDYSDGTMGVGGNIVASVFLDGPAAGAPTGSLADGGVAGKFQFTNIPPFANGYRVRVKATESVAGSASPIGGSGVQKADNFFTTNNSGWAISENKAMVTNGTSVVSYVSDPTGGTTAIDINVPLRDGVNDNVAVQLNPTSGTAPGGISSGDL